LTEAEWEYACRAGSANRWCFSDNETKLDEYAWYAENSDNRTQPVGLRKENAFKLHDMHGNVWEWVEDYYDKNFYLKSPKFNPVNKTESNSRVLRGGAYGHQSSYCRSGRREMNNQKMRKMYFGFRVAKSINIIPNTYRR